MQRLLANARIDARHIRIANPNSVKTNQEKQTLPKAFKRLRKPKSADSKRPKTL